MCVDSVAVQTAIRERAGDKVKISGTELPKSTKKFTIIIL